MDHKSVFTLDNLYKLGRTLCLVAETGIVLRMIWGV